MKYVILVLILVLCATSAFGFDGNRKGFVLGGGIGLGYASVSLDQGIGFETQTNFGGALNFLIGYAWDEQNMIVFLRDGVLYSDDYIYVGNPTLAQGFSGIGYYHYFGLPGKSFFVTGGLGFQDLTPLKDGYEAFDVGLGILGGGGYEFTRHVQIYGSLSYGKTGLYILDFTNFQFQIGVSAVAF